MIEIVCDGMNATKSYTREAGDVKSAIQISKRHIANDSDNWVVIRNEESSYMIMQENDAKYGVYSMQPGTVMDVLEDLTKAVELCYALIKKGK